MSGISAFAFQGSNAHMLFGAADDQGTHQPVERMNWKAQLLWVAPRAHAMVTMIQSAKRSGLVSTHCKLNHTALSYLWDHRMNNTSIFTIYEVIEMSLAAAHSLMGFSGSEGVSVNYNVTMPSPLPLAAIGSQNTARSGCTIACELQVRHG